MSIDYALMKREFPKQKAALTRALNKPDAGERRLAVTHAARQAVKLWDRAGAWPDDWARWQRALEDVYPWYDVPRLESL